MATQTLSELMVEELKDLYSAETQLLAVLPKMAKKATSPQLQEAFTNHLKETEGQLKRLQKIAKLLNEDLGGKKCKAMEGLIKEGSEALEATGPEAVVDSGLIGASRRVEHYEIAAYCSTRAMAVALGNDEIADLLEETFNEEEAADGKLKSLGEDEIFPEAAQNDTEENMVESSSSK